MRGATGASFLAHFAPQPTAPPSCAISPHLSYLQGRRGHDLDKPIQDTWLSSAVAGAVHNFEVYFDNIEMTGSF